MADEVIITMSEPIRTAIIGLGRAGWGMQCTELDDRPALYEVVGGCDLHEPWRRRFSERYPAAKTCKDMQELLDDPNVELVSIATRSIDHFEHSRRALEAGKIVLVEKPMCARLSEAEELVRISRSGPGTLYVRHNRRFEPGFLAVRQIIASGILGRIAQIKLARTSFGRRNDWQTLLAYGGGQLSNWGSHIIDHALQFLGAPESPPAAQWSHLDRVAAVGDAEDHVKILLRGHNNTLVDIEVSGGAALPAPEYLVWGDRGALELAGTTDPRLQLRYLDPGVELPERAAYDGVPGADFVLPSGEQPLSSRTIGSNFGAPDSLTWIEETRPVPSGQPGVIWEALYESIRGGAGFPITLKQALAVMRIIESAREGSPFALAKP